MTTLLTTLSFMFLSVSSMIINNTPTVVRFIEFMEKYSKSYSPIEHDMRFEIFKHNLNLIDTHNSQEHSWKMEVNQFTDLTWEEFIIGRKGLTFPNNNRIENKYFIHNTQDIPTSLDWRDKNVLNPVKNQEQCGSCWAFSAIGAIESAVAIKRGKLYDLSEQQLVDCSSDYGNGGCNGGLMDYAFQYAVNNKLCSEEEYPYTSQDGTCKSCEGVVNINGFTDVQSSNETALLLALLEQPISVAVEADQYGFQFYSSGVFDGTCGINLDHGVLLVGFGRENNKDYWLVRNSWGSSWGDGGYIKLIRGVNQCGISLQPSYPIV